MDLEYDKFKKFHEAYNATTDEAEVLTKITDEIYAKYRNLINNINAKEHSVPFNIDGWRPLVDDIKQLNDCYLKMKLGKFILHVWTDSAIYIEMPQDPDARFADNNEECEANIPEFMQLSWDNQIVISPSGHLLFRKQYMDVYEALMMDGKLDEAVKLAIEILTAELRAWGMR